MEKFFGLIAGLLYLFASGLYVRSVLKRKTIPNRTTWFIWSLVVVVLYISAKAVGGEETLWVARSEMVGVILIALLSLKYGKEEREKGEIVCLIGAIISILILFIFKLPLVSLVAILLTDTFGTWPTIQKTIKYPEQEDLWTWVFIEAANFCNLFAIRSFPSRESVYPIWLFVLYGVVLWLLLFPKNKQIHNPA